MSKLSDKISRASDSPHIRVTPLPRLNLWVACHHMLSLRFDSTLLLAVRALARWVRRRPEFVKRTAQVARVVGGELTALDTAVQVLAARVALCDTAVIAVDGDFESSEFSAHTTTIGCWVLKDYVSLLKIRGRRLAPYKAYALLQLLPSVRYTERASLFGRGDFAFVE